MSDAITIRRFRTGDEARIRDLHETAMRDAGAYVEGVSDDDLGSIPETYLESGGEFLVGEREGCIVAMGAFRPIGDDHYLAGIVPDLPASTVELTRMRVDPDHQRRGFGRRLYDELERRARDRGYAHVALDTRPIQTAARGLYESVGFERTHRERIEAVDDPFDLLVYQKSLAPTDG